MQFILDYLKGIFSLYVLIIIQAIIEKNKQGQYH